MIFGNFRILYFWNHSETLCAEFKIPGFLRDGLVFFKIPLDFLQLNTMNFYLKVLLSENVGYSIV